MESEILPCELEGERLCLTRLQVHLLEAFQFTDWTHPACHTVMDIELHHFFTGSVTSVCHLRGGFKRLVPRQLLGAQSRFLDGEGGVTHAMPERIQRLVRHLPPAGLECARAVSLRAARPGRIVKKGLLARVCRKADGKMASRIVVAKKDINNCRTCLCPQKPGDQNCRCIPHGSVERQRTTCSQQNYHRGSCCPYGFCQCLLRGRDNNLSPRLRLTRKCLCLPDSHYNHVGSSGCCDRSVQTALHRCLIVTALNYLQVFGFDNVAHAGIKRYSSLLVAVDRPAAL
mmetsp:Transcript_41922/g.77901  ORF Transcript_41922/g.77901 Transcript_41922/m.77901 type:complete len:286 (+) Transcript_41922:271-1128(+)